VTYNVSLFTIYYYLFINKLQGIGQLVDDFVKKKAPLVFINVQVGFVRLLTSIALQ